jgi:hypothetical protein
MPLRLWVGDGTPPTVCPVCKESIKRGAIVCPHCHHNIAANTPLTPSQILIYLAFAFLAVVVAAETGCFDLQ